MKRTLDLTLAGLGLLLTAPLLVAAAILIRLAMGAPVLFSQERAGRGGRPFRLYKFRTMRPAASMELEVATDEERLTPLGRWLRRWSVDELPQLWNVCRGDMSLVGPRPLPVRYLSRYSVRQARRHEVLPGLTGWAQIHGRNAQTWSERLEYDVWYVDHRSLSLDFSILGRTLRRVVDGHGVSGSGGGTMEEFQGT
jgi:sugar transferase EpsL